MEYTKLESLIEQWHALPKGERNSFYRKEILPNVSLELNRQYQQYLKRNNYNPYSTLITTLSHDINIALLLLATIKPQQCVIFYTSDRIALIEKLKEHIQSLSLDVSIDDPVLLDSVNQAKIVTTIKETLKRFKKTPTLCDITGGKKIISTQIGIIAHLFKLDIAYIDSKKGYLQWGIPHPGSEILYIQKPDNIFNTLELYPANKLRIRYNTASKSIEYEADVEGGIYRLGTKKIKESDTHELKNYIHRFYDSINASIINRSYRPEELKHYAMSLSHLLFTRDLINFFSNNSITHLVIDNELHALPWEILCAHYNVAFPLFRIPNRMSTTTENKSTAQKSIALICGSGKGLPNFETTVQNIKLFVSNIKEFTVTTVDAKSSFALKRFFAEHGTSPFTIVVYFGHAVFNSGKDKTGLLCQDGSIFSIDDCDVLGNAPPECVLVNACHSARCDLFCNTSFAHAVLSTGVDTYIGTHFFLEYNKSIIFLESFLHELTLTHSYSHAYKQSIYKLIHEFGQDDISKYNFVYYGY